MHLRSNKNDADRLRSVLRSFSNFVHRRSYRTVFSIGSCRHWFWTTVAPLTRYQVATLIVKWEFVLHTGIKDRLYRRYCTCLVDKPEKPTPKHAICSILNSAHANVWLIFPIQCRATAEMSLNFHYRCSSGLTMGPEIKKSAFRSLQWFSCRSRKRLPECLDEFFTQWTENSISW